MPSLSYKYSGACSVSKSSMSICCPLMLSFCHSLFADWSFSEHTKQRNHGPISLTWPLPCLQLDLSLIMAAQRRVSTLASTLTSPTFPIITQRPAFHPLGTSQWDRKRTTKILYCRLVSTEYHLLSYSPKEGARRDSTGVDSSFTVYFIEEKELKL